MDIWMDAFVDSMKLLPFLFLTYLFIEWYEHVSNPNLYTRLISLRRYGPLFGALIGCIPQCGFSVKMCIRDSAQRGRRSLKTKQNTSIQKKLNK